MIFPMFSLIIPVYNVAPYLRECLDSVRVQTFTDWECLCVDDGSTDGSSAILDEYAESDSRFHVFHQENGGVSSARNLGVDNAQGKWVWFVDADDIIREDALLIINKTVQLHPQVQTVFFRFLKGISTPVSWPDNELSSPHVYYSPSDDGIMQFSGGMCMYAMRRSAIGTLRFERFPRGEDTIFLLSYARNGFDLVTIPSHLYFYRQRQGSAVHSVPTYEMVAQTFDCLQRHVETLIDTLLCLGVPMANRSWAERFRYCYRSYCGMFFQLCPCERKRLLGRWFSILEMIQRYYRPTLEKRIRIRMIRITQSGFLVKYLAFGWIPCLKTTCRFLRFSKRLGLKFVQFLKKK